MRRGASLILVAVALAGVFGSPSALFAAGADAADEPELTEDETAEKDFVVLPPVSSYAVALRTARAAAAHLRLRFELRDSRPDGHGGLTFPPTVCEDNGWDFPCYVTRGRFDDGLYVSIDESSVVDSEVPGYVVVLASGPKDDPDTRALLERARAAFPAVELRTARIYQGCIH